MAKRFTVDGRRVLGGPKLGVGHLGQLVDDRPGDAGMPAGARAARKTRQKMQRQSRRRNRAR